MENEVKICQSCGMPLDMDPEKGGTNSDGSKSDKYCSYCYSNGIFTQNVSLDEMTDIGLSYSNEYKNAGSNDEKEEIRNLAKQYLSNLERWKS
jgi:hypothetical protein